MHKVLSKGTHANKPLPVPAGVPIEQQSIMFAGKQLQEDISLQDYALDQYTLADEVSELQQFLLCLEAAALSHSYCFALFPLTCRICWVATQHLSATNTSTQRCWRPASPTLSIRLLQVVLYMYKLLLEPKLIYLCGGQDKSHLKSDTIEYASPMSDVMALLESRQLAAGFSASSSVLAKRRDGSTIPVALSPSVTLQQLEDIVAEQEQLRPNTLCFYQAPDGSLHVSVTPSNDQASSADCYPVYARAVQPQPLMHTKPKGSSMRPLTKDVVHELCVLP